MSATPESKEEIRRLFRRHVPEIEAGSVEIVYVVRNAGRRSYVAVHSYQEQLDPVGACTGSQGARLKAMASELKGEHLTVVRWDKSAQNFICNALAGICNVLGGASAVSLNETTHRATVTVNGQRRPANASDLRLIEELTGWSISLVSA
jgi:N utilization substance protein A